MPRRLVSQLAVAATAVSSFGIVGAVVAPQSSAHNNQCDSVDGDEIRYEDHTQWDTARTWGITKWNAHNAIDIEHDAWYTVTDLEYGDAYIVNGYWGTYYHNCVSLSDSIFFNGWRFSGAPTNDRRHTGLHELGHALGFTHNSISGDTMYTYHHNGTGITSHAHSDFHARWGY